MQPQNRSWYLAYCSRYLAHDMHIKHHFLYCVADVRNKNKSTWDSLFVQFSFLDESSRDRGLAEVSRDGHEGCGVFGGPQPPAGNTGQASDNNSSVLTCKHLKLMLWNHTTCSVSSNQLLMQANSFSAGWEKIPAHVKVPETARSDHDGDVAEGGNNSGNWN